MKIFKTCEKTKYLPLLLLADEQQSAVDAYIDKVDMFVLDDNGIKGEICVLRQDETIEIKNLAVYPQYQRQGYGRKLIDFVCNEYKGHFCCVRVGTGDSPLTLPFYVSCGFKKSSVIKNFFVDNYDHPIYECGKQLVDMIYLEKKLI